MTLNEWMERNDRTHQEGADATGMTRGYFSRIMQGVVIPNLDTALRIYDWTGGQIDLRSLVPARITNPRLLKPAPIKGLKRKAA